MEVNIIFDNVKAYNVEKVDVRLGEDFKLELINIDGPVRWFSDNDPVLSIKTEEDGLTSSLKSTKIGQSEVQLQQNGVLIKTLFIEVYDDIAVALNPVSSDPELK